MRAAGSNFAMNNNDETRAIPSPPCTCLPPSQNCGRGAALRPLHRPHFPGAQAIPQRERIGPRGSGVKSLCEKYPEPPSSSFSSSSSSSKSLQNRGGGRERGRGGTETKGFPHRLSTPRSDADNLEMHWGWWAHLDTPTGARAVPARSTSLGRGGLEHS